MNIIEKFIKLNIFDLYQFYSNHACLVCCSTYYNRASRMKNSYNIKSSLFSRKNCITNYDDLIYITYFNNDKLSSLSISTEQKLENNEYKIKLALNLL